MRRPPLAAKIAVAASALCVALSIACVWLATHSTHGELNLQRALEDPEVRREIIGQLLSTNQGVFDSHPDPDVGRLLLPNLKKREFIGVPVSSNDFGLPEHRVELPKPDGTVRVVLVGDSFVFGYGARQEERLGVHLERMLAERAAGFSGRIEVLHYGIGSWNLVAEAEYVRRQLSLLQPDCVIQLSISNDLDDCADIRGFGARSNFSSQARENADAMVFTAHSTPYWGTDNYLCYAFDWEGATRLREGGKAVQRLALELERRGGTYLLIGHWASLNGVLARALLPLLGERRLALFSPEFYLDPSMRLSAGDPHWNAAGHEKAARLLYALILERKLLPGLALAPWKEAQDELAADAELALADLRARGEGERGDNLASGLDFHAMDEATGQQVLGGIDDEGRVGPYGVVVLRRNAGTKLALKGRSLERPEIDGARVTVHVDEHEVGSFTLQAGTEIAETWPLPKGTSDRITATVRFSVGDYCYVGPELRHCVAFELDEVRIVE